MGGRQLCLDAPAKINLYLKITGRRPDGYHELATLMQKLALFDTLCCTLVDEPGIHLTCPGTDLPVDEGNIVYRAAGIFLQEQGRAEQGVEIIVQKKIPVAAGLGGGSSDAAVVLLALNQLLAAKCSTEKLAKLALRLGADVPLFVHDMPCAWATGIGEQLKPAVSLTGYQVLLVNPGIFVSTKWAYETFALTSGQNIFNLSCSQKEDSVNLRNVSWCTQPFQPEELANDLETVTADKFSVIDIIKNKMLAGGAAGALMSGSGSTVFGLFADDAHTQATRCYQELQQEYDQVYLVQPLC